MAKKKEAPIQKVRIIGIFAHVDAGKTTTTESILYFTGRIHRTGEIDSGDTQMDFMAQERERGITIMSAATACHWQGHRINIIDTPGHIDFTAEVVRSIRVIDGAVVILCGVGGVEPQTEAVWFHANNEHLPRLIFINKLDRTGADFERVLGEIAERLTPNAIPLELPIGSEGDFRGIVDLLTEQAWIWHAGEEDPVAAEAPPAMGAAVAAARERLIDSICETDDDLLMRRLEGEPIELEMLQLALRQAVIDGEIIPVLCGTSRNKIGVQPLLDAIMHYLPAPVDMPPIKGRNPRNEEEVVERPDDPGAPFCASAFKIVTDPHVGHLTWVRVFSGRVETGDEVLNPRTGSTERVGRIYRMHANRREQVGWMAASDVVALVGVKEAMTGDTLCDPEHPIVLETFKFPEPVISVALTPRSTQDREKLHAAVMRLCDEDPTLLQAVDAETGELTLSGMGELHLDVTIDRLRTEFGLAPEVSPPQVSYRETVQQVVEVTTTYKKQTGGHGHFAEVVMRIEPLAEEPAEQGHTEDGDVVFVSAAPPAELPRDFWRPTELGLRRALAQGVIAGFPVQNVKVTLLGGKYHEVDSAAMDFEIAGGMAARRLVRAARPALLEPIMGIDINVPEDYVGNIVADIGRRRGTLGEMRVRGHLRTIDGEVPLSEARGYATELRSMTQGRGTFTLEFRRYDLVPENITEEVIKERKAAGKIPER
ncbi:MAG: elongation factor G [Anaerolineae bacterium]|nr:elongation factor G [Anaerolineae bacterium]